MSLRTLSHAPVVLAVLAMIGLGAASASAQEDVNSPPPPLQWPTSVSANPNGHLPFQLGAIGLRHTIEEAADLELCKTLMKDANIPIPEPPEPPLTYATCPSAIKAKIDAREGKVAWAEGARPTECGPNCLGQPFMSQTQHLDRPNSRFAMVYGKLTFHVDVPGPFNRNVFYNLEIDVTCDVPAGTRSGTINATTHTEGPVADDPGLLESITSFLLLPLRISDQIDAGIKKGYRVSTNTGGVPDLLSPDTCTSIGASAQPPDFIKGDEFVWDVPKPPRRVVIVDGAVVKPTATLYFDRVIRNHTIESNPSIAPLTFTLYINGMPAHIPRNGTISLSPNGARHEQKYCRTIPMDGVDSLQILFVDSLGGAVWSQFTPAQNFGSGRVHKMTTGRTYLTPGLHPGKPQKFFLSEFELDYRVDYHGVPTSVGAPAPSSPTGVRPRPPAGVLGLPDRTPPDSSCIKI